GEYDLALHVDGQLGVVPLDESLVESREVPSPPSSCSPSSMSRVDRPRTYISTTSRSSTSVRRCNAPHSEGWHTPSKPRTCGPCWPASRPADRPRPPTMSAASAPRSSSISCRAPSRTRVLVSASGCAPSFASLASWSASCCSSSLRGILVIGLGLLGVSPLGVLTYHRW